MGGVEGVRSARTSDCRPVRPPRCSPAALCRAPVSPHRACLASLCLPDAWEPLESSRATGRLGPTPPSCAHPASLRAHTQPGCLRRRGPSAPRPAPTRRLKPLAPIANNLCLSRKQRETEKAPALCKTKDSAASWAAAGPLIPRECAFFFFYFKQTLGKKTRPSILEDSD